MIQYLIRVFDWLCTHLQRSGHTELSISSPDIPKPEGSKYYISETQTITRQTTASFDPLPPSACPLANHTGNATNRNAENIVDPASNPPEPDPPQ
ncbi:MAG: hypothetical protein QNK37_21385 [Acidobacteriota bacterium]|nr:hypothetical protein [Acidobacteriota bacterium]